MLERHLLAVELSRPTTDITMRSLQRNSDGVQFYVPFQPNRWDARVIDLEWAASHSSFCGPITLRNSQYSFHFRSPFWQDCIHYLIVYWTHKDYIGCHCNEHGMGLLWLVFVETKTGADMTWNSQPPQAPVLIWVSKGEIIYWEWCDNLKSINCCYVELTIRCIPSISNILS